MNNKKKIENFLQMVANFIARETGRDREVLLFGLRLLLSFVAGYALLITISCLLGIQLYTLTAAVTASILRVFSGGAHATSQPRCWLLGIIIFIPAGFFLRSISPGAEKLIFFIFMIGAIYLYGLIVIHKYAPGPTPGKPISSQVQRQYLRKISFILLSLWGVISLWGVLFLHQGRWPAVFLSAAAGMFWQLTSLTPFGYKAIKLIDLGLQYTLNTNMRKEEVQE